MKKLATIVLTLLCFQAFAQKKATLAEPRVDRNVELLGIVFRLAGNPEYGHTFFKQYTDRIEEHFGAHRDHELIGFAGSIREKNGISYDAVASMAIHLDEDLNRRTDVTENSLDWRWKAVDREKFVALLKKFAADSDFDGFFEDNADLYAEAAKRFRPIYEAVDLKWYADFFGREPREEFIIVNALGGGGGNYGPSVEMQDGRKEVYAVMGAWNADDAGMVVFPPEQYFATVLHEFNHSFFDVRLLADRDREAFKESGEKIFAVIGDKISSQGYPTWEFVMNEAMVRAAVIKYMKDHSADEAAVDARIRYEKSRGFDWISVLVAELEKYDSQRDAYPTLEDYMPRLAETYEIWAGIIDANKL